eukprot:GHVH01001791.1.p1 GENE.GHVH01001791.1~~GHVH01001791.1.p1  ORF type:complete len:684 (+),score=130.75 GHVH01001791.1:64-2052(+)
MIHLGNVFLILSYVYGAYVGLDLGNGSFKASLVQSGKKPAMLINPQSSRTTPSALMLHRSPRLIGSTAIASGAKLPNELITLAHSLAGSPCTDKEVPWNRDMISYDVVCDEDLDRFRIYVRDGQLKLWPEDIISHYLDYVKQMAITHIRENSNTESVANASIRKLEFNIVLPVGATYRQQVAYENAAKIAGVKLSERFDSQVAAAAVYHSSDINLGESDSLSKIIMDVGAYNASACRVTYFQPKGLSNTRTTVHECYNAPGVGGLIGDWAIAKWAIVEFEKAYGELPEGLRRQKAMNRLVTEANKKKHVLSANRSAKLSVENLDGSGNHLDLSITRDQFDNILDDEGFYSRLVDLLKRFESVAPLHTIVESVEWIGNGWRIPSVQERLQTTFSEVKFKTTINADEAPALGGLFLVARDAKYKSPKVNLVDHSNENLTMSMTASELKSSVDSLEQLKREDEYREQLEKARNDFEDYLNKVQTLLSNDEKINHILEDERIEQEKEMEKKKEMDEKKEANEGKPGWLSSMLSGNTGAAPVEIVDDAEVESTNEEVLVDDDGDDEETSLEETSPVKSIAECIPNAKTLLSQAHDWVEKTRDENFDKTKSVRMWEEIKTMIEPLTSKMKEQKAKREAEKKIRLEEKKEAKKAIQTDDKPPNPEREDL